MKKQVILQNYWKYTNKFLVNDIKLKQKDADKTNIIK